MNLLQTFKGIQDIVVTQSSKLWACAGETDELSVLIFLRDFVRFFSFSYCYACTLSEYINMMGHGIWHKALLAACVLSYSQTSAQQNGADFSVPSTYTNWDNDNWVLITDKLIQGQYQSRAPMGNG